MLKEKYTKGEWARIEAGYATMIYGENGERVCKVIDNKNDADIIEDCPSFIWLIEQIYYALPKNKDWLSPDLEAMMAYIIQRYCIRDKER